MAPSDQKRSELEKSMPSSMILIHTRAQAYRRYVSGLKGGKRSGISQMFGSAEDLFSDDVELPPTPKIDAAAIELGTREENQWRTLYLIDRLRKHANKMMKEHVRRCRAGEFGPETQKAFKPVGAAVVSVVIKESCALYLYLTAIEQDVFEENAPQWLQEYFGLAVSVLDMDLPGRSVEDIMSAFDYCDVGKLSQKLASSVGKHVGFGSVGEHAWNDLRKRILGDGPLRYGYFESSLTLPLSEIKRLLKEPD